MSNAALINSVAIQIVSDSADKEYVTVTGQVQDEIRFASVKVQNKTRR